MSTETSSFQDEKKSPSPSNPSTDPEPLFIPAESEDFEVFKKTTDGVDFRTVGWVRASVIFLKIIFATGVLTIPVAFQSLGAVGGALSVVAWGMLTTYTAVIQGDFRNEHPGCHSIADMAEVVSGPVGKEIVGFLFIAA